uniref:Uncharacterized protein n=1 Tax=Pipistrellus kuhlii TaxID=59472 RepID=A0A7J7TP25_PIPKU|nr:hypothetical protein mPipKuh1_009301 [Pipistrellus kuhlii]
MENSRRALPAGSNTPATSHSSSRTREDAKLASSQEANSKQTRETKARAGLPDKRALVSGLKPLPQIGQRKERWEEGGGVERQSEARSTKDDINRTSPNSTECSKKEQQMSAQPSVNPCGAAQEDLEGNSIAAVGIRSEGRTDDTCLPLK